MRAQIQFGESIIVVMILVFIMVIGFVFYFNTQAGGFEEELRYRDSIDAIKLAKNVLALPEVQCSAFVGGSACVDEEKLAALARLIDRESMSYDPGIRAYYEELFGYAAVEVHPYPFTTSFTLYEDDPPVTSSRRRQNIFTTLYDPETGEELIAYLDVTKITPEVTG